MSASGVVVREAGSQDRDAIRVIFTEAPMGEAVGITGSVEGGRRLMLALVDFSFDSAARFLVAESGDEPGRAVGFAQTSTDGSDTPGFGDLARIARGALGTAGALRAGWRSLGRRGVELERPGGGLHLSELHVLPGERERGIGGALLDAVDTQARARDLPHVSLITTIDNPARRLYDRHGYVLARERRNRRYERVTGSPGRVLMVKPRR